MLVVILLAAIIKLSCSNNGAPRRYIELESYEFNDILESACWVDKSLLIKEFLTSSLQFILITAPRRFGKSTNMDMVKRFCEVTVDENGNRMQLNLTTNYKLFTAHNLNIFKQDRVFFSNHFGKYPVIYLDFKELSCNSYKSFIRSFKRLVRKTYKTFKYLLNSDKLSKEYKYDFKEFYQKRQIRKLEDYELHDSVKTLTSLLHSHFNKTKCIVLIDEYDGPIQKAIFKSGTDLDKIVDFIRKFISISLKSNTYVARALINACIKLGTVIAIDANNIQHIPFLADDTFSSFYGFTEEEVKLLLEKLKMSDMLVNVREWYDGYKVENSNITIYNPFSIVNYLKSKELKKYWVKSGDIENLEKIFLNKHIRDKIDELLVYNSTEITLLDKMNVYHIVKFRNIINSPEMCSANDVDLFLQFMVDLGYFNIISRDLNNEVCIEIPNHEIKTEIKMALYSV